MLDRQWATCRPRQNEPHKGLYFPRQFDSSVSEARLLPSSNLSSRSCQVDLQRSNLWQRVLACGLIVIVALSTLQASLSHHCQPSEGSWPSSSSLARRPPSSPLPLPTTHQPSSLTIKHFQNSLFPWKGSTCLNRKEGWPQVTVCLCWYDSPERSRRNSPTTLPCHFPVSHSWQNLYWVSLYLPTLSRICLSLGAVCFWWTSFRWGSKRARESLTETKNYLSQVCGFFALNCKSMGCPINLMIDHP